MLHKGMRKVNENKLRMKNVLKSSGEGIKTQKISRLISFGFLTDKLLMPDTDHTFTTAIVEQFELFEFTIFLIFAIFTSSENLFYLFLRTHEIKSLCNAINPFVVFWKWNENSPLKFTRSAYRWKQTSCSKNDQESTVYKCKMSNVR